MKVKRTLKKGTSASTPTPNMAENENSNFPPGTEFLAELNAEKGQAYLTKLIPELNNASDAQQKITTQLMAGVMSGISTGKFEDQVPEWAQRASSNLLFGLIGIDFNKLQNGDTIESGKLLGLIESKAPGIASPQLKEALINTSKFIRSEVGILPANEIVDFYTGTKQVVARNQKNDNLPQRTKAFGVIALHWKQIEKFTSAGELHRWLVQMKIIVPQTDAAETRKICRIIGLKFRAKAGRPSKK